MRVHDLKTWPSFFAVMLDGSKTFEARRNDRDFAVGDQLLLREWDPAEARRLCIDSCGYTGREMRRTVSYVMRGGDFGLERGFAILGLGPASLPAQPTAANPTAEPERKP